jgi:multisubunit Na+/H+ antiporter MnhC subunit
VSALHLNAILGSLAVAFGFWLIWPDARVAAVLGLVIAGTLMWYAASISRVWVWSTALLGLESLAWPLTVMIQARGVSAEPTPEQMGQILTALVGGLFSSIFWLTFAYGLYKRTTVKDTGDGVAR